MLDIIIAGAIALSPINTPAQAQDVHLNIEQAGVRKGKIRIDNSFNMSEVGVRKGKIRIGTSRPKIRI